MVLVGAQLYDAATPGKPQLLCTVSGAQATRFATAKEVSYVGRDAPGTLVRLDFASGTHTSLELAAGGKSLGPYAWSADGKNLAYWVLSVVAGQTGGAAQASQQAFLKVGTSAAKKLTEEMPVAVGPAGYGDSLDVRWSPTGKYVAIVNTHLNAPHLQVFLADGSSAFPSLGEEIRGPVAAAWGPSGDLLYIADQTALRTWAPPDTVTVFSDGQVFEPALCQGGCALAYTLRRPDIGQPKVHVLSLVAGNSDQNLRSGPVFVAPGRLWYFAEEPAAQDAALPYLRSGKIYEYDIQARLEVQLPVTGQSISDVWPRF
jgi:hypothetical protein